MWQYGLIVVVLILLVWFTLRESFVAYVLPQRRGVIVESGTKSAKVFNLPTPIEAK